MRGETKRGLTKLDGMKRGETGRDGAKRGGTNQNEACRRETERNWVRRDGRRSIEKGKEGERRFSRRCDVGRFRSSEGFGRRRRRHDDFRKICVSVFRVRGRDCGRGRGCDCGRDRRRGRRRDCCRRQPRTDPSENPGESRIPLRWQSRNRRHRDDGNTRKEGRVCASETV